MIIRITEYFGSLCITESPEFCALHTFLFSSKKRTTAGCILSSQQGTQVLALLLRALTQTLLTRCEECAISWQQNGHVLEMLLTLLKD